jgi:hypothetical protein
VHGTFVLIFQNNLLTKSARSDILADVNKNRTPAQKFETSVKSGEALITPQVAATGPDDYLALLCPDLFE